MSHDNHALIDLGEAFLFLAGQVPQDPFSLHPGAVAKLSRLPKICAPALL